MQDDGTSLMRAAARGHKEMVEILLKAGANIEAKDEVSDVICGTHACACAAGEGVSCHWWLAW